LLALASSSWYWYGQKNPVVAPVVADSTPSLAVLPFENLGKSDDSYFVDGMTEEISSRLGAVSGLRLIGRQSAKSYANTSKPLAQIGKELGVAYLLTGSVRWDRSRAGHNLVKVTPALLRANDGVQMWSEPYQDEAVGVFDIQGKVAGRVAQALQVRLTEGQRQTISSRPTNNLEAYDYYLRAQALEAGTVNPSAYSRAIVLYQRAVAADSGFAGAHAALARAHLNVYWFRGDPSARRLELAKASADKALALDPGLPAAHLALADYYYHGKLDFPAALAAIEDARRLAPNDPASLELKGLIERRRNRWNEAVVDLKRASEIDPRDTEILEDLCETQLLMRNYDEASKSCARIIAIDPQNQNGYTYLAWIPVVQSGDSKRALAVLADAKRQLGAKDLADALASPEWRQIWPTAMDPELVRYMEAAEEPVDGARRLGYLTSSLMLAVYQKKPSVARQFADSIIVNFPRSLHGNFFDSEMHAELSLAYGATGDRQKTLEEAKRAMDILPVNVDALRGPLNLYLTAQAEVLAGAYDEALTALRQVLSTPCQVSRASLRVDPWFEPLRQDPRFKRLIAEP
ncbi:MAG TPA: tetratricopeptide repeat protein, partial [Blastocatellia bacterium]|nr:tetratricopeptide repeat protein [Blastocatellia bacterium]